MLRNLCLFLVIQSGTFTAKLCENSEEADCNENMATVQNLALIGIYFIDIYFSVILWLFAFEPLECEFDDDDYEDVDNF